MDLLTADGLGSVLDLSSLGTINTPFSAGCCGESFYSIAARGGGFIDMSSVSSIAGALVDEWLRFHVDVGSDIDLSSLTQVTGRTRFDIDASTYTLPILENASGTVLEIASGTTLTTPLMTRLTSSTLSIEDGGTLSAPLLTDVSSSFMNLNANTTLDVPPFTNIDNTRILLTSAVTVDVAATSLTFTANVGGAQNIYAADGTGAVLNMSALTDFNGAFNAGCCDQRLYTIAATNGGVIDMSSVTTVTGAVSDEWLRFLLENSSVLDLSSLTTVNGRTRFDVSVPIYSFPSLQTTTSATWFNFSTGSQVSAPQLTTIGGASNVLTVPVFAGFDAPQLTSMAGTAVNLGVGGVINAPNLTSFTNGSITISPGRFLNAPPFTNIDNSRIFVDGGAEFSVAATSYLLSVNFGGTQDIMSSDGSGSRLDLSRLESFNVPFNAGCCDQRFYTVAARNNGTVDMSSVSEIGGAVSDEWLRFSASNGGSIVFGDVTTTSGRTRFELDGSSSSLVFRGGLELNNTPALLTSTLAGTIEVAGDYTFNHTNEADINIRAGIFHMNGIAPQHLEVGGEDIGLPVGSVFNNFEVGQLIIGQDAQPTIVNLVDEIDNGNRGGGVEALYLQGFTQGEGGLRILGGSTLVIGEIEVYVAELDNWTHINSLFPPGDNLIVFDGGFIAITPDCNTNGIDDTTELDGNDCNGNGLPDECDIDCNTNGTPDVCEVFADCDSNGVPDECDPDCNNNGTVDACEAFADCNLNGIPDECDTDCDASGTPDDCEVFDDCNFNDIPDQCELTNNDCNVNNIPDECEADCDASGTPDDCEVFADCNLNKIPDVCELSLNDCNTNNIPDDCETDCNLNGEPDDCDVDPLDPDKNGLVSDDCNIDSIPDECQLVDNDCNANEVPDECEADCNANKTPDACDVDPLDPDGNKLVSEDCNTDGVPDECQLVENDCQPNGMPDDCDIASGASEDCDLDGIPDSCEVFADCNENGVQDTCDITQGVSPDVNVDDIPDECQVQNLTQGTVHLTIAEAIAAAGDEDELLAPPEQFTAEPVIDFQDRALTLQSSGDLSQPNGGVLTMADGGAIAAANDVTLAGDLTVSILDEVDITGDKFTVDVKGSLTVQAAASVHIVTLSESQLLGVVQVDALATLALDSAFVDILGDVTIDGGTLAVTELFNFGNLDLFNGQILADIVDVAPSGQFTGAGDIFSPLFANSGDATFIADSLVVGDYRNNGITIVQSGTLTITGTLQNNGTLIGDVIGGAAFGVPPLPAGDAFVVLGDFVLSADSTFTLALSAAAVKVGGAFDAAVNDNTRFEMSSATLQTIGIDGATQSLEQMSLDIGDDPLGLDPTQPGHFPIGTLRIGPAPSTAELVDNHDNDGLGQESCEALYVRNLIVDAGATLIPGACTTYYVTVVSDGTIMNPEQFDQIVLVPGDHDADEDVDIADTLRFPDCMTGPNSGPPPLGCEVFDFDEDDDVDVRDFATLLQTLDAAAN